MIQLLNSGTTTTVPADTNEVGTIIDNALEVSDAINTYGSAIVLLSVFLVVFIIIILVILKQNSNNQKVLQDQNQLLINKILENEKSIDKVKQEVTKSEPYDEKSIVGIFVKLNKIFKFECKRYLERIDCDRIGIYVFHNGVASSHGLPFFKVTCIAEWIKRGSAISTHLVDTNGIPLNLFDDVIEQLYTKGVTIVCNDDDRRDESLHLKTDSFYLDTDGADFAIFVPVYDKDDNICACVLAEYKDVPDDNTSIDTCIEELKDLCESIKPTLEFSNYKQLTSITTTMKGETKIDG